jgi:hypothetical protein
VPAIWVLVACSQSSTPTPLATGTYTYEFHSGTLTEGTSTVTISSDGTAFTITEDANWGGSIGKVSIVRRLDPATFSIVDYRNDKDNVSASFTKEGATYRGNSGISKELAPPDAAAPSSFYALYDIVSSNAAIPAMLHATGKTSFNMFGYNVLSGVPSVASVTVVDVTAARPNGVPLRDESLALERGSTVSTIWYDPDTFIVHAVDVDNRVVVQARP